MSLKEVLFPDGVVKPRKEKKQTRLDILKERLKVRLEENQKASEMKKHQELMARLRSKWHEFEELNPSPLDALTEYRDSATPDNIALCVRMSFPRLTASASQGWDPEERIRQGFFDSPTMQWGVIELLSVITLYQPDLNDSFVIMLVSNKDLHQALIREFIKGLFFFQKNKTLDDGHGFSWNISANVITIVRSGNTRIIDFLVSPTNVNRDDCHYITGAMHHGYFQKMCPDLCKWQSLDEYLDEEKN